MSTGLPEAPPDLKDHFLRWLDAFSACVREVDYATAKPMFHRSILAFGTHTDVLPSLDAWVKAQWDNVWPKTSDFRFKRDAVHVLVSDDGSMAVVVAPWDSTGYHPDGSTFDRPGRATMVFHRTDKGWLGVHTHLSLNRGVPQTSHANRPVKAW